MAIQQSAKIFPFLWYAKEAEEAARFYASIFPNSRVDRVWSLPTDSPSGPAGSVKVVDFVLFGQRFQAMTAGPHHDFNDAMSIVVTLRRLVGAGPLLERASRERRDTSGVRVAERPVRCAMANRPGGDGRDDARRRRCPFKEGR